MSLDKRELDGVLFLKIDTTPIIYKILNKIPFISLPTSVEWVDSDYYLYGEDTV